MTLTRELLLVLALFLLISAYLGVANKGGATREMATAQSSLTSFARRLNTLQYEGTVDAGWRFVCAMGDLTDRQLLAVINNSVLEETRSTPCSSRQRRSRGRRPSQRKSGIGSRWRETRRFLARSPNRCARIGITSAR